MNKYQRALKKMKQGATWQKIADQLGEVIGEKIHRSDPWNVYSGRSSSTKVETALKLGGWVYVPKKRFRLAAEFSSPEEVERFKRFYGIGDEYTFTDMIDIQWQVDQNAYRENI